MSAPPNGDAGLGTLARLFQLGVPRFVALAAVFGVLWTGLVFMTGGLRPQTQIDVEAMKAQLSDMRAAQAAIQTRLDALPRNSDFTDWQAHLSRLDALHEALRDRTTQAEYQMKDLNARLQGLTVIPYRGGR